MDRWKPQFGRMSSVSGSGVIESILHPWIRHAAKLARDKHYRGKTGRMLVGGKHICEEYWARGGRPIMVAATKRYRERYPSCPLLIQSAYTCTEACAEYVTREGRPEGILAEISLPIPQKVPLVECCSRLLVLVSPSLPGNLGTLVRSAKAFGWEHVLLVGPSADPFAYEAVRTSKGATLYGQFFRIRGEEIEAFLHKWGFEPLVASPPGTTNSPSQSYSLAPGILCNRPADYLKERRLALILGNESFGVKALSASLCSTVTSISITMNMVESINVAAAGAILMNALQHLPTSPPSGGPGEGRL